MSLRAATMRLAAAVAAFFAAARGIAAQESIDFDAAETRARWERLKASAREREEWTRRGKAGAPPKSPTLGTVVGLTLLVDFPMLDSGGTATNTLWNVKHPEVTREKLEALVNGEDCTLYGNASSVRKYFEEVSCGHLVYTNVFLGPFVVSQPRSHYDVQTGTPGEHARELIGEVFDLIKAAPEYETEYLPLLRQVSYAPLTSTFNGFRALNVWFAGPSATTHGKGLWAHKSSLTRDQYSKLPVAVDGGNKYFYSYQISPVTKSPSIGTFCHENGHLVCGFPDLYDSSRGSGGPVGNYSLMAHGGDTLPVAVDAYLRVAAGWVVPKDLPACGTVEITNSYSDVWRWRNPNDSRQYYLIENRQRSGRDGVLPSGGIMIWRCNESGTNTATYAQTAGFTGAAANRTKAELALEQADGLYHLEQFSNGGDWDDTWRADNTAWGYANEFSAATMPCARWDDGSDAGVRLYGFSANGDVMTFRVGAPDGTFVWTGGAGDALFSSGGNWDGGAAPTNGANVVVSVPTNSTLVCDIPRLSVRTLLFHADSAKVTLDGGPLAVAESICNQAAQHHKFRTKVVFPAGAAAGISAASDSYMDFAGGLEADALRRISSGDRLYLKGNVSLRVGESDWGSSSIDFYEVTDGSTLTVPSVHVGGGADKICVNAGGRLVVLGDMTAYGEEKEVRYLCRYNRGRIEVGGKVRSTGGAHLVPCAKTSSGVFAAGGLVSDSSKEMFKLAALDKTFPAVRWAVGAGGLSTNGVAAANGRCFFTDSADKSAGAALIPAADYSIDAYVGARSPLEISTTDAADAAVGRTVSVNGPIGRDGTVTVSGIGRCVFNYDVRALPAGVNSQVANPVVVTNSATLALTSGARLGSGALTMAKGTTLALPGYDASAPSAFALAGAFATCGGDGAGVRIALGDPDSPPVVREGEYPVLSATSVGAARGDFTLANAVADGCTAEFEISGGVLLVLRVSSAAFSAGDDVALVGDERLTIDESQAGWLNDICVTAGRDVVVAALAGLDADAFAEAHLLGLDVTKAGWRDWSFRATAMSTAEAEVGNVAATVSVALVRAHAVQKGGRSAPVNGTLGLGLYDPATGEETPVAAAQIDDATFANGDAATAVFTVPASAGLFRARIAR